MACVERLTNVDGQNAIVQALARLPEEILPPNPNAEVVEQVAPDGFGITEQQLTEHTDAEKRRFENGQHWSQWQNSGWYQWWDYTATEAVAPGRRRRNHR